MTCTAAWLDMSLPDLQEFKQLKEDRPWPKGKCGEPGCGVLVGYFRPFCPVVKELKHG
jgi:hypothetical protein